MIIVSDTSPLNYLILIDAIHLLPVLFQEILAPSAVIEELKHPDAPQKVRAWAHALPSWVIVRPSIDRLLSTEDLGAGEAQAISIAKELSISEILIDERRGTRIARSEGLVPLSTLAVLERAAESGLIELPVALDRLKNTTNRLSAKLIQGALERDALRRNAKS